MSLTVSDIITEYGAYYIEGGQNRKRVLQELIQGLITPQYMTPIKTNDTLYRLAKGAINNIVQAFQKTFTQKGTITFTSRPIQLYHLKVDDEFYPDDIEATWLGFLANDDLTRKTWPLVKYVVEAFYIPQIKSDVELSEIFHGVYVEPTDGVAGTTGASMNGINHLLTAGVADGTMNAVDLGTLSTSNIFDKVEEFVDAISQLYQGVSMNVFMSESWKRAYMRDKRAQGFYQLKGDGEVGNNIDFTPQNVVGLPSMVGSDVIFATPKNNFLYLTKKDLNMNRFNLEEAKRVVSFMTDFWIGVGFGINEIVWVSGAEGSGS